ncbi:uncharacterized protein METZ01_LOCUS250838 [marine metagenome]|uniref:Uncharacterized protein n=1 Tax=marine metagenome TaxID=408172 RepID=A0A382IE40_9ZZZZ
MNGEQIDLGCIRTGAEYRGGTGGEVGGDDKQVGLSPG